MAILRVSLGYGTHWEFQTKLIREIELHSLFPAQFGVQVTVRYSVEACPSSFPEKKK
jgi:hypothetical protein